MGRASEEGYSYARRVCIRFSIVCDERSDHARISISVAPWVVCCAIDIDARVALAVQCSGVVRDPSLRTRGLGRHRNRYM